jgi:hypothetical protein
MGYQDDHYNPLIIWLGFQLANQGPWLTSTKLFSWNIHIAKRTPYHFFTPSDYTLDILLRSGSSLLVVYTTPIAETTPLLNMVLG